MLAVVVETSVGDFEVCVLLWERKSAEGDGNPYTSAFLCQRPLHLQNHQKEELFVRAEVILLDGAVMENDLVAASSGSSGNLHGNFMSKDHLGSCTPTQIQTQIFIGSYLIVLQTSP